MIRTEEEILKSFEKLGYKVVSNSDVSIKLYNNGDIIRISKYSRWYSAYDEVEGVSIPIDMQEHKLLHELFTCWCWSDEKED